MIRMVNSGTRFWSIIFMGDNIAHLSIIIYRKVFFLDDLL